MFFVEFVPGAARQVADARDGWFANRDKAPFAFDEDLEDSVGLLKDAFGGGRCIRRHEVDRMTGQQPTRGVDDVDRRDVALLPADRDGPSPNVWYDGTVDRTGLAPHVASDGCHMRIATWHEDWLDRSQKELAGKCSRDADGQ